MPLFVASLFLSISLPEIAAHAAIPIVAHGTLVCFAVLSAVLLLLVMLWSLFQTLNHNPPCHFARTWLQLLVFYVGFTMPWWMAMLVLCWLGALLPLAAAIGLLLFAGLYFYAVYRAPRRINVNVRYITPTLALLGAIDSAAACTTSANSALNTQLAVVSDLRLGLFSHPKQLLNLVDTLNALNVDAVLIIGEWLYNPCADLVGQLMLLKGVNKPLYVSQSRHDQRYYPNNADLLLQQDDLAHTFAALGARQITLSTPTELGLTLIATDVLDAIQIIVASRLTTATLTADLAIDLTADSTVDRADTAAFSLPAPAPVLTLLPASNQTDLVTKPLSRAEVIPSFGQRGLPLRLAHPSITVLHLKAQ